MDALRDFRLEHIRQFVRAAELLHFGRAAEALGIAQPVLSRTIQRIERSVGVPLFDRSRRQIRLTSAGQAFLNEATRLLDQAELARRMATRAAEHSPVIRVGGVESAVFALLPPALRAFRERSPETPVTLEERIPSALIEGLFDGTLDLVVTHEITGHASEIETAVVYTSRLDVAVPAGWPLARRRSIRLRDLAEMPFAMIAPEHNPAITEAQLAACRVAGFTPQTAQQASNLHTLLAQVASGAGVTFAHALMKGMAPEVAFVRIDDVPPVLDVELTVAWVPRNVLPAMRSLIELLGRTGARLSAPRRRPPSAPRRRAA